MLSLLSLLLLAPLLSPQHHIFLQQNRRMCSVVLLSSSAACGECEQSLYAASWKMCVPLKWSAEKRVRVQLFQFALLYCSQGLKWLVSNTPRDLRFCCRGNATCHSYPRSPEEQRHWRWPGVLFMQFGVCYWKWQQHLAQYQGSLGNTEVRGETSVVWYRAWPPPRGFCGMCVFL